jgi:hypothetical protein
MPSKGFVEVRMKTTWVFMAVVLLGGSAAADHLVLKDGKRIEWKSLKDLGDRYEVETSQGRITVDKADIDSVVVITKSPMDDKRRPAVVVDLLRIIDPSKDAVSGALKMQKNGLFMTGLENVGRVAPEDHGRFKIRYVPPEEYDLTIIVERKEGLADFGVGLFGGGKQIFFIFDAPGFWSGPCPLDGKGPEANGHGKQGRVLKTNTVVTLSFAIRKDSMAVKVDGKDFWSWQPGWERFSSSPVHFPDDPNVMFLECYQSSFLITKMVLTGYKEAPKRP